MIRRNQSKSRQKGNSVACRVPPEYHPGMAEQDKHETSEVAAEQDEPESSEVVMVSEAEMREVGVRLHHLERIHDTITHIADGALDTFSAWAEKDAGLRKEAQENEDKAHKRVTTALVYIITLVFALSLAALLKNQFELVKLILTSSLAVAAGAGLTSLIRNKSK
jgi:uncharacterized membrane protein